MTKTSKPTITDVADLGHDGFRITMSDGETTRYHGPEVGARADVEASALAHWDRCVAQIDADADENESEPPTGGFASSRRR